MSLGGFLARVEDKITKIRESGYDDIELLVGNETNDNWFIHLVYNNTETGKPYTASVLLNETREVVENVGCLLSDEFDLKLNYDR